MSGAITAPQPLTSTHIIVGFNSGEATLDAWLCDKALKNEGTASRTYVVCEENRVIGYYSLAVGSIARSFAPGFLRRNMPEPLPVMILARLAIDLRAQGKGLGRALIRDALLRTGQAADIAGMRLILVHALHEKAATFYRHCGFVDSPLNPLILMLDIRSIRRET